MGASDGMDSLCTQRTPVGSWVRKGPQWGCPLVLQHGWQGRAASAKSAPKHQNLSAERHSAFIMKEMSLSKPSIPLNSATRFRDCDV